MTDHDQQSDEPAFDDPSYDDLRALLAGSRVQDPIPGDVAARLDATLADLVTERGVMPEAVRPVTADVLPLHRRSRWAPRLLAAAAVVAVLGGGGVALSQVVHHQGTSPAADSAKVATASGAAPEAAAPSAPAPAPHSGLSTLDSVSGGTAQLRSLPEFTTSDFAAQATSYRVVVGTDTRAPVRSTTVEPTTPESVPGAVPEATQGSTGAPTAAGSGSTKDLAGGTGTVSPCPGPTGTDAVIIPINLDGVPAALAVHPVVDGLQLYEAWTCDGSSRITYAAVSR